MSSCVGLNFNVLVNSGTEYIDKCVKNCKNIFWKNVLLAWKDVIHLEKNYSWESPLWFNKEIKINGKYVFYNQWYEKGVYVIGEWPYVLSGRFQPKI